MLRIFTAMKNGTFMDLYRRFNPQMAKGAEGLQPDEEADSTDPKTAAEIDALLADVRGETKRTPPRHISREQALAVFHERYRPSLVRSFEITDTLPDASYTEDGLTNCWFVQFVLTYDDMSVSQPDPRLVAVSKSTGGIVYDDSDEG